MVRSFKSHLMLLFVLFLGVNTYAQERGFAWGAFGSSGSQGSKSSSVSLMSYVGYNFTSDFALLLQAENNLTLTKEGESKKNHMFQALGGILKYNVYKFNTGILDLRAGVGTALQSEDWKFMYYDIGVFLQATRDRTKPTIGVGFRKYHTFEGESTNRPSVYVSVGFTVN